MIFLLYSIIAKNNFKKYLAMQDNLISKIRCISSHSVLLLAEDQELFMPYDEFPWFKDAPVRSIINVQEMSPGHFYWPDLDVDLSLESIIHPERFPLKSSAPFASADCLNN